MSQARRIDAHLPALKRYADKMARQFKWPKNPLLDGRISHKYLKCPRCGRIRHYNRWIDAVVCRLCELVWYRGRCYKMKDWDKKWAGKLKKHGFGEL